MNQIQEIAQKRIDEIDYSTARIEAKIEAGHPRKGDLEARLKEYALSRDLCEFSLKTGRRVRLKGDGEGVEIAPPAGNLKMEGK